MYCVLRVRYSDKKTVVCIGNGSNVFDTLEDAEELLDSMRASWPGLLYGIAKAEDVCERKFTPKKEFVDDFR